MAFAGVLTTAVEAAAPAACASVDAGVASEKRAVALAKACGVPVEVTGAASVTTKVMASPSGRLVTESSLVASRVEKDGRWRSIDAALKPGADGWLRPVAAIGDVRLSPGGERFKDAPFVSMSGGGADFTLGWSRPLPQGVVSGDSVTYPNVYDNVDLVVRATRSGFSHVLVVKTAAAAAKAEVRAAAYRVGGTAKVERRDGALRVAGPGGEIATAAPAVAWDSTTTAGLAAFDAKQLRLAGVDAPTGEASTARGPGDLAQVTNLDIRVEGANLTVVADEALRNAKRFPVFIDPTFERGFDRWAPLSKSEPNKSWTSGNDWPRQEIRVGSRYDAPGEIWRAAFKFNTEAVRGRRIKSAWVDAKLVHTGHCVENIGLWHTDKLDTPTWNGVGFIGLKDNRTVRANSSCGNGDTPVRWDAGAVRELVQGNADIHSGDLTMGLRIDIESDKRWVRFDAGSFKLQIEFDSIPHSPEPTRTSPGGGCNRTWPGNWINDNTPALYGKAQDDDNNVHVRFDLTGPTDPPHYTAGWSGGNAEVEWTTPWLSDGDYDYRIEGYDEGGHREYTGWSFQCFFRVDATPPAMPSITRKSGTPVLGQPVVLEVSSFDERSGVRRFEYGVGVDARDQAVDSGGTSTITFTPEAGRTVVYVWAQDHAGNYSTPAAYDFYTGQITQAVPQALWRFNGDGRDDSDAGRDLTAGAGVSFGPDRSGSAGAAMVFNGTGCATSGSVVRGDGETTVAGWVKITDKSSHRAMFSLSGSNNPTFVLAYKSDWDAWEAATYTPDGGDGGRSLAMGPSGVPLNTWQHLAATVDPAGRSMKLYVNGKKAAETGLANPPFHGTGAKVGCGGSVSSDAQRMHGAVDDLGVWRGLLSEQQIGAVAQSLPAVAEAGQWPLRGNGVNASSPQNPVSIPTGVTWADDAFGRTRSAMAVNGAQCAPTATSVVRTDESFTASAWVRLNDLNGTQTFVGQDAGRVSGFYLGARGDRWSFQMKGADLESSPAHEAKSANGSAVVGRWTHLTGAYDAVANQLSLYVDGIAQTPVAGPTAVWNSAGPFTIGCARYDATATDFARGAVSDVRVWRGALSAAKVGTVYGGNPPVSAEAWWWLDGPASIEPTLLADSTAKHRDLSVTGTYEWTFNRGEGLEEALGLQLAENSCATTTGPAVRTDGSFTVAGWVLLDRTSGDHTVMSQAGAQRPGFQLDFAKDANRWRFAIPTSDSAVAPLTQTLSLQPPTLGRWTHIAGVYDLGARKIRLYVDGVLQGEAAGPAAPWQAAGPTHIGCRGTAAGGRTAALGGALDEVGVWTSTLHPDRIAELANSNRTPNP